MARMSHDPFRWSRRRLLRGAGKAALGAALAPALDLTSLLAQAPGDTEADRPISEVMRRLSTYMSDARCPPTSWNAPNVTCWMRWRRWCRGASS